MNLIRYFIHSGIAVSVLCVTILMVGLLALFNVPIQLTPNVQTPTITVSTFFPGATPQDVEQDILVKQEEFLRGVRGLQKMTSTASSSSGEIQLEFSIATDMGENLLRVNNALSQVSSYPENVDEPSLSTSSNSDQPVAWFSCRAVPGSELDIDVKTQFDYLEDFIKTRFERIPGIASVQGVYGASSKEMQVYIDPVKLSERGVTIYQVREALRKNNRDISGGDLQEGKRKYIVRTVGRFRSALDVENTIITVENGTPIYIRDIGYARLGMGKDRSLIRHNGRPALCFGIRHQPGTNLLMVMEEAKALAKNLNENELKERNMFLTQITDDTEYVAAAVQMVRNNMLTGGILALIILLLFLRHLRSTLIIGAAIPLCVLGSVFLLNLAGRSINVISLAGLAFSIGVVLDNSIVVLENIFRHRQLGKDSFDAAIEGTEEVWTAIFSASMTNVIVFAPIITLQEQAGQLFRDIAIAITATNILSFIIAILVIPCIAAHLLKKLPPQPKDHDAPHLYNLYGVANLFHRMSHLLEGLLNFLMRGVIRRLVVVAAIISLAVVLIFGFFPKTEYLPEGNQNSIFALMLPPQGYNLEEMSAIGITLEEQMRPLIEASLEDYHAGRIKEPPLKDFFFISFDGNIFMFIRAKDPKMASLVPPMMRRYMSEIPGMIPIAAQRSIFDSSISGSRGIDLDIIGPSMEVATGVAFQAFMKSMDLFGTPPLPDPGIEVGQPQLTITPRWTRAAELGISTSAIGYGAWVLGDGAYCDDYYESGKKYDLYLYSTMGAFDTLANFDTMRIATDAGDTVPLSEVAEVSFDFVPQKIRRVDQQRAVTLSITPPIDISLEEATGMIQESIVNQLVEEESIPPGYKVRIGGSVDKLSAIREVLKGDFLLAIVLVYLVLVLILHHWGHPLTILLSVPIGLTGGVLGLAALNIYLPIVSGEDAIQSLDVLTMLGFVILLGSIVNNPILIVEQSVNFMKKGEKPKPAIVTATMTRIRPMLMTTSTTIFGLAPLVLIPGAGSELYRGLGVVMFGGLLLGTVITTVFIPSLMSLMFDLKDWFSHTKLSKKSHDLIEKFED